MGVGCILKDVADLAEVARLSTGEIRALRRRLVHQKRELDWSGFGDEGIGQLGGAGAAIALRCAA